MSVIIPNWNGLAHLESCLDSLSQQTRPPDETIVVDNGSTDGSIPFITSRFPWVRVVPLQENMGFAFAVNRGIEAANGEFIALINNDTALAPLWVETMVEALKANDHAGSAACKMLRFFERSIIDAAGDVLTRSGSPYSRGSEEPDDGRYNSREWVFGACAGASIVRKEVFRKIGLFDEDFISYYEDVDFAFRAQLAGFRCLYVPEAICFHKRGATSVALSGYAARFQERNLTCLYVKDFPALLLISKLPIILASRVRRLFRLLLAGSGMHAVRGTLEGVTLAPKMLAKRMAVQRTRTSSIAYLRTLMRGAQS